MAKFFGRLVRAKASGADLYRETFHALVQNLLAMPRSTPLGRQAVVERVETRYTEFAEVLKDREVKGSAPSLPVLSWV